MRVRLAAATLAIGLVSCAETASQNGALEDVILIRASEVGNAYPLALGQGTLVTENGCLAMQVGGQAPGYVLWPPTFDLQRGDAGIEVVDGDGNLVAGVGEPVQLGGGWMYLSAAQDLTGGRVPMECRVDGERYFIASPGRRVGARRGHVAEESKRTPER